MTHPHLSDVIVKFLHSHGKVSTMVTDATGKSSAMLLPLVEAKHAAFAARKAGFDALWQGSEKRVGALLSAFQACSR